MAAILDFSMETFYDQYNAGMGLLRSNLVHLDVLHVILLQILFKLSRFPFSVVSVVAILDSER